MSSIPADVMEVARTAVRPIEENHMRGFDDDEILPIARAVMAERERCAAALRLIDQIVHTPTKRTRYSSAQDHYQGDFDQIRKLTAPFRVEGDGNVG